MNKSQKKYYTNLIKEQNIRLKQLNDIDKNNKDIVLMFVSNNGLDLYHATDRLKNNKEVVLTAIKNNPYAIAYASDEINALLTDEYEDCFILESLINQEKLEQNIPSKEINKKMKI